MGRGNGEPDPGPSRTRNASKRLLDGSGEGLGAAQQALVNETNARIKTAAVVATLIQHIEQLSPLLPSTITEGTEEDEIYRVITTVVGQDNGSVASTFNRRFDILFKEDAQCRDQHGRLHLIRRGELGMLMVAYYLRSIKWIAAEMDLAGAMVKLERIVKEMEYLWCVPVCAHHIFSPQMPH
ncbi:hypothetical protein DFH09DRAFT_601656 [Mycena vulgaris]|nr:hypothetical protein DFH09DRAFT_186281 [Mycena vulgaris]KAJ6552127.1 hypothetical protein DFH09DRAFT_601656 [Mycena vulgaris]